MAEQPVQLTLEVGGEIGAYVVSEFALSGKVSSFTDVLEREEPVMVQLVGADGEVIFSSHGWVKSVEIETVPATSSQPRHTRRKHKIRLGENAPPATE